jgi:transcription termination/antitermination protein NusG
MDKVKLGLAVVLVVAGVWGYYHFSDLAQVLRVLMVLGGLIAAGVVARFTEQGRELFAFGQEAWQEAGKVSWPTRKETIQTTLVVFARMDGQAGDRAERRMSDKMNDKKWYVVHAYSGFEKSVQRALNDRIKRSGMADQFGQILVPVEEVVEMKNGARAISERKFFPGYVLVEMEMTDDTWHLVKSTPKVTGFVGGTANKPTPITQKEVDAILQQVQEGVEKPRPKVLFELGEAVRVKEGPFTDFHGNVEDVNYEKSKLRVSVTIFGRSTPVELDFSQVEKA